MRSSLLVKFLVVGVLALVIVLPLSAILGLVHDRQAASDSVLLDVQQTGVRAQSLVGPILVVPFARDVQSEVTDPQTGKKSLVTTHETGRQHFLPDSLEVRTQVTTETRYRGIYSALLYQAQNAIQGSFSVPEHFALPLSPNVHYELSDAYLIFGVGDTRGIKGVPSVKWDGGDLEWKGGTEGSAIENGVHAEIGALTPGRSFSFVIELALQGTQALEYVPVGKDTRIQMHSSWPHPSFNGQFLPETRTITAQGFDAAWRTSHLASNVEASLRACLAGGSCRGNAATLGVSFIEPVNVYLQTQRAAKYGFLFVVITFVVFQLFELLKKLAIHPVQYGLVGIALALFFLLLLALTEHLSFALAYLLASTGCVGLIGFYVSYVLRSLRRAASFTGLLSALYASLYVLLRSEDMALLLGAILLFGILAAIMVITRRVDWYGIAQGPEQQGPPLRDPSVV